MGLIAKPTSEKLNPMLMTGVPNMELPDFRFLYAQENRVLKNILIKTPYALGDCVCAEPAIRFAQKNFTGCTISLMTPFPELFRHIPNIKKVYSTGKDDPKPDWEQYYVMECYHAADAFQAQFVHNFNMAIEDYICVSLFKGMIPVKDRNIVLHPNDIERHSFPAQDIVIHAGKHWMSKTFPKKWWDSIIHYLLAEGVKPTLIGAKMANSERAYVEVDSTHCMDLRDKTTVMQTVAILQRAKVVLSNDSAPYHMACSGDGNSWPKMPEVGVISTVRHFDFIGHWRRLPLEADNGWNYKITNLSKGQMWQPTDVAPGKNGGKYDIIDFTTLMKWLPEPKTVADWAISKLR